MQNSYILHCDDTIDGLLTALYDGFVIKKKLGSSYDDCISISIGSDQNYSLFSTWIEIMTDPKKASLQLPQSITSSVRMCMRRYFAHSAIMTIPAGQF
jgi:hypothetical protein